jgi:hypothetical protein
VENKKKLIRKLAQGAGAALGLGLAVLAASLILAATRHEQRAELDRRARAEAVQSARQYLGQLAQGIRSVPVDPTLVGEVQAKYFEDVGQGRRFVWGTGVSGDFLFGVPREAFARLNAVWDANEEAILADGFFVDRQDFLRRLANVSEEITEPRPEDEGDHKQAPWSRLRHYGDSDWLMLSAPLKDADGKALGNVYLKMRMPEGHYDARDDLAEGLLAAASGVSGVAFAFLWFLLPTWVYVDARERGVRRAGLWSFLVLISLFVGLVVYLIARPEEARRLTCPGCGREVDGGAFCPHCGRDLATAFCATCRYPLKPDWAFCPSCRTEVPRGAAELPPAPSPAEG